MSLYRPTALFHRVSHTLNSGTWQHNTDWSTHLACSSIDADQCKSVRKKTAMNAVPHLLVTKPFYKSEVLNVTLTISVSIKLYLFFQVQTSPRVLVKRLPNILGIMWASIKCFTSNISPCNWHTCRVIKEILFSI